MDPQRGGTHLGTLRLTHDAVLAPVSQILQSDYEAEGFAYLAERDIPIPDSAQGVSSVLHVMLGESLAQAFARRWRGDRELTVIRFEVVSWTEDGERRRREVLAP